MASLAFGDAIGTAVKYTYKFPGSCPLNQEGFVRLTDQVALSGSDSSTSTYDGDPDYSANPMVSIGFHIIDGGIRLYVGHVIRLISEISDLPGNDKVLRYVETLELDTFEKRIIRKFTAFIVTHNIYWTGPFNCLQSFSNATEDDCDCMIEADRPVPLHRSSIPLQWKASYIGKISNDRSDGAKLFHFYPNGPFDKTNINRRYFYAGCSGDEMFGYR